MGADKGLDANWITAGSSPDVLPDDGERRFVSMEPRDPDPLRLYCIMSMEAIKKMNGSRGKLGTQAGHAYLHAWWDAEQNFPATAAAYKGSEAAFKITLRVETDAELRAIYEAHAGICGRTLVEDAGYTIFGGVKTLTCIGLGPIPRSELLAGAGELKGL